MAEIVYAKGLNPANIRWARERKGIDPAAAETALGVSWRALSRWESVDTDGLPLATLRAMVELYDVPLAFFFIHDERQFRETLVHHDNPDGIFDTDLPEWARDERLEGLVESALAILTDRNVQNLLASDAEYMVLVSEWIDAARRLV